MKGFVLDFSLQTSSGLIAGDDGRRYLFSAVDWKDARLPHKGMKVDFAAQDDRAVAIYALSGDFGGDSRVGQLVTDGFYKSSDDKVFSGVCAGLAKKWQITPSGCRIATVILVCFFGAPLIIYIVLWVALPAIPTKDRWN